MGGREKRRLGVNENKKADCGDELPRLRTRVAVAMEV